jgi:hypothetical protein
MEEKSTKPKLSKGKRIKFALFTLLFFLAIIFIISETLLYFFHYQSSYDKIQLFSMEQAKWWTCDSVSGPRYVVNGVDQTDVEFFKKEPWYYNRLKIVNNEGYHDRDNFVEVNKNSDSLRVLMVGDSFTWGASADVDSSYVDVFERDIKKVYPGLVWNTGVPGTGTNHALFTAKKFLPLQKSNYVILGFYTGNDFSDNLLPFDQLVFTNKASCYNLYSYDKDFKPYKISKKEAYEKATGSAPMEDLNFIQKILVRSRLISFVSDLSSKLKNKLSGQKKKVVEEEYNRTKEYIKELNDYTKANNAELIVSIIPTNGLSKSSDIHYQNIVKILNELSIKYVESIDLFTTKDYMESGHWINSGHIKAGHLLSEYLLQHIKQKQQSNFKQP